MQKKKKKKKFDLRMLNFSRDHLVTGLSSYISVSRQFRLSAPVSPDLDPYNKVGSDLG